MHRSGTSATAGALAAIGIPTAPEGDLLVKAGASNARGHWESRSLMEANNMLFRHFGGTWSAPPRLSGDWYEQASLSGIRAESALRFGRAFAQRPALWKDPRLCITLPFWRSLLEPPFAAVFVYRSPMEVAKSLKARSGIPLTYGLASWERHVRSAASNLSGMPTLAADYGQIVDDPHAFAADLVEFLGKLSVDIDPDASSRAGSFFDSDLRHQDDSASEERAFCGTPDRVMESLRSFAGQHHPWEAPDLGDEPEWVEDVLGIASRAERATIDTEAIMGSRAYRFARSMRVLHKKVFGR